MEERIKKIEQFIESLKNPNTFPKEIKDTLINIGFLNFEKSLNYEGGVGGNVFEQIIIKYLNQKKMISVSALPFIYVVNSTSGNILSFVSDINPLDLGTTWVLLYTTDTYPGGLDVPSNSPYLILNPTATTFQLSSDGINPIDITSVGIGTQYMSFI